VLEDRNLTAEQWKKKTEGMNELGIVEQDMYPRQTRRATADRPTDP
jgi:hypothetical protein